MSLVNKLRAMPRYRLTVLAVFLVAAGGVCGSFFGQYVLKMNPCVMCIQQRLALVATMLIALLCLALPHRKLFGRTLAAVLISAPAAFGAWVAAKQIHLQSLPPAEQPDCGAPLSFVLKNKPLFKLYEPLLRGDSGFCGEVHKVLGVSLPVWSVMFFAAVLLIVWVMWLRTFKQS